MIHAPITHQSERCTARDVIKRESDALARWYAEAAEVLLVASNRLRDQDVQAHLEAASKLRSIVAAAPDIHQRLGENIERWRLPPEGSRIKPPIEGST